MESNLIEPHGGSLVNLLVTDERSRSINRASRDWPSWDLTQRQLCDLELLVTGGFSPLEGFMTEEDYAAVVNEMRLSNGTLWPMPIVLDVTEEVASGLDSGDTLALRDPEGVLVAAMRITDIYRPDRVAEAKAVFGTDNIEHPGVCQLLENTNPFYIGGHVEALQLPTHYDFHNLRQTPAEVRTAFATEGWSKVVAFQTRNPMHRAHQELTMRAAEEHGANLLIHPVVGMTKPGDVDHYTRVRCYQALLNQYPEHSVQLSLLPLAMRMGGPREAVWHAIIRKNFGCTHLIVGRDHAGPGSDSDGNPFYGPYDAQDLLRKHEEELGVTMVPFRLMVYVKEDDQYMPIDSVPEGKETLNISGTELRHRLVTGDDIPDWFTYPEVVEELRKSHPTRENQGFTVFFTGLSGSGKSTVANALMAMLLEIGGRPVTLLDGDHVRKNLSSELGFSKEHRDLNIQRIGFVAAEITKHGGIAICAPIAPYDGIRRIVRTSVESGGGFILVYLSTPLEVCEQRDRKGLYAKARAGIIKEFTGISDPYEEPENAELVIDTTSITPKESARIVVDRLIAEGYLTLRQEPAVVA